MGYVKQGSHPSPDEAYPVGLCKPDVLRSNKKNYETEKAQEDRYIEERNTAQEFAYHDLHSGDVRRQHQG